MNVLGGGAHPDRDPQCAHIHDTVQAADVPVISVDDKHGGREWPPATLPVAVNVSDYPDKVEGQALP